MEKLLGPLIILVLFVLVILLLRSKWMRPTVDRAIENVLHSKLLRSILAVTTIASLLILIFSISYPAMKRAEKIDYLGSSALANTGSLSTALTHFAADDIQALIAEPNGGESFKELSGLLARIKESNNLDKIYVLYKKDNQYNYLLDASYRDNATPGVDYNPSGTMFSGAISNKTRSVLDKVYSGKLASAYNRDLVTTNDHREVVVSYTPIADQNGQVLAVLAVESNTSLAATISTPGNIDFTIIAVISGVVFFASILLILTLHNWKKTRKQKMEREISEEEDAVAEKVEAEVVSLEAPAEPQEPQEPEPLEAQTEPELILSEEEPTSSQEEAPSAQTPSQKADK